MINMDKNRNRDKYSFANINMLGKCNADCFFCLGKDIECVLSEQNQMGIHFSKWLNFDLFLNHCRELEINKIYLTGQNTDPLLYSPLEELINYIQNKGFFVGLELMDLKL